MSAAVMVETPQIRNLARKKEECERKLPLFQATFEQAQTRRDAAKKKQLDNRDPQIASDLLVSVRLAETSLEAAAEPLRVAKAQIEMLKQQIDAAKASARQAEKERLLEEWRSVNEECDEQQIAAQKKRVEKANACMARLHELDPTYAHVLVYGDPKFYLTDDVLKGKHLPSLEIEANRATFKWLELPIAIRS